MKGFDVVDFKILTMNKPDGSNMEGTVYIPNPSVMTLQMVSQFLSSLCGKLGKLN